MSAAEDGHAARGFWLRHAGLVEQLLGLGIVLAVILAVGFGGSPYVFPIVTDESGLTDHIGRLLRWSDTTSRSNTSFILELEGMEKHVLVREPVLAEVGISPTQFAAMLRALPEGAGVEVRFSPGLDLEVLALSMEGRTIFTWSQQQARQQGRAALFATVRNVSLVALAALGFAAWRLSVAKRRVGASNARTR